jgi:trehalose 6-phosphate phosphatase
MVQSITDPGVTGTAGIEALSPSRVAVLTDFDGTLVEIAETPDAVQVPASLPALLGRASAGLDSAFAVITGRKIADIDRFLAPLSIAVAGSHGIHRRRADGSFEDASGEIIAAARGIASALEPFVAAHPALLLEPKDGAVALHYRQAPELEQLCHKAMTEAIEGAEGFVPVAGKMVIEARPKGISKGTALRAFMQEEPFAGRVPVFIGDDTTDEDAFVVAQELGGIGIKLGHGETAAKMRIADVASVHALIQGLGKRASEAPAPGGGPDRRGPP